MQAGSWRRQRALLSVVLLGALASAGLADLGDFKLAGGIPSDVFLAVHGRSHKGMAFVNEQYGRVWKALGDARLDRELKRLIKEQVQANGGDIEQFEQGWQRISDMIDSVEWSALCKQEWAFALRIGMPTAEWLVLCRPEAGKSDELYENLSNTLQALANLDPTQMAATTDDAGTAKITSLRLTQVPIPMALSIAQHKDTIAIAFGGQILETSLALLDGGTGQPLAKTERFSKAVSELPPPQDAVVFFDADRMFKQLQTLMDGLMQMAPPPAEGQPGYEEQMAARAMPAKLLNLFDMIDTIASVSVTDGMKTTEHSVTRLKSSAKSKFAYEAFFGNPPLDEPLQYVPKDATNVSAYSGIDLVALYDGIIDFVRENVPDGASNIEEWEQQQQAMDFDVKRDLLSWIQGALVTFSVAGPTPYSGADWAMMVKVSDAAKAQSMLDQLYAQAEPMLAQQNGSLTDADIAGAEGFKTVNMPMLMMIPGMGSPTLGVHDGWMVLGSKPKIIEQAFKVGRGEVPSFRENERFKKEGVDPRDKVLSLTFTDLTGWSDQTAQMLGMVSMVGMFGGPELAQNPGVQLLTRLSSKLQKVVREVNFLQSSSAQSYREGEQVRTTTIVNYREPPKPATADSAAGGSENP